MNKLCSARKVFSPNSSFIPKSSFYLSCVLTSTIGFSVGHNKEWGLKLLQFIDKLVKIQFSTTYHLLNGIKSSTCFCWGPAEYFEVTFQFGCERVSNQIFRRAKFSPQNIPQQKADTNYPFTPSTPDPNKNRAIYNLFNGVEKFPCATLWRPILPCCHF